MRYFLSMVILLICLNLGAQDFGMDSGRSTPKKDKIPLKERLFFGGNLGAQFGNYTYVSIAPMGGYKITDRWSVGLQPSYTYISLKSQTYNFSDNIYGGSVFTRYFFFKGLFAHTEYNMLNGNWRGNGERFSVNSFLVGGGYLHRFTDRAGFGLTLLFNLLDSPYSPYQNPILNAGFTYGL
ncbi:MAG: hypothetical protein R2813_04640 [Flavobacteriales bacterium]